tara:strand:+ start:1559 stop:1954 length:396 start_codon:yes stop_codon:yes gene_type:complete
MSTVGYTSNSISKDTQNEVKNKGFSLPNTIRNITFHFIKVHYNKYLEDHNITKIGKEKIPDVVNELYEEKEQELKKYIRGTMRKNFPDYDKNFTLKTSTEEIILEMFDDPDFSKNRIIIEIENYQRKINSE